MFAGSLLRGAVDDETWESSRRHTYTPGRTLGARVDGAVVAAATSFPCSAAVPGGAVLDAAAVTGVGVRADHTRRGLVTALVDAQLSAAAARGEVLASLRATETGIYGRFGFGVATRGRAVRVRGDGRGWRSGAPAGGRVRLLDPADVVPVLSALHDRLALRRPGGITRPGGWWTGHLRQRLDKREAVLAAVHTGPDGDDGFAVASVGGGEFARRTLTVDDLHAADVPATAALWRFLLGIDLATTVEAPLRPLDEPLELLLADPRDATVTGTLDETWLRLLDVPAALAARSWGAAEPVLLAVHDPFRPVNTGVYRLDGATAQRVTGPPHLECDVAALAMAYLGDRAPSELAATGWWTVHDPAALPRADALFATGPVPWCGTFF